LYFPLCILKAEEELKRWSYLEICKIESAVSNFYWKLLIAIFGFPGNNEFREFKRGVPEGDKI